jgi:transcriptional regulator with XRE-family HTH domain
MPGKRRSAYVNLDGPRIPDEAPTEAVKIEFARRLQRAMVKKGWNQSELARQAKIHLTEGRLERDNISHWIRGKNLPGPANLHALAEALGVSPADLLPSRGIPSAADKAPPLDMRDLGDGNVWLKVNQAVDRRTALRIMNLLMEGDDGDVIPGRSKSAIKIDGHRRGGH